MVTKLNSSNETNSFLMIFWYLWYIQFSDGYHVYFYSNYETSTGSIKVVPILFNVGINEQAISSNL